jgi:hypothetical protein
MAEAFQREAGEVAGWSRSMWGNSVTSSEWVSELVSGEFVHGGEEI